MRDLGEEREVRKRLHMYTDTWMNSRRTGGREKSRIEKKEERRGEVIKGVVNKKYRGKGNEKRKWFYPSASSHRMFSNAFM